jgi:hypothetical protein
VRRPARSSDGERLLLAGRAFAPLPDPPLHAAAASATMPSQIHLLVCRVLLFFRSR